MRVGIITFDKRINFYDVKPCARDPVKIIVQHPDDCFPHVPLSHWLHSPYLHDADSGSGSGNSDGNGNVNNHYNRTNSTVNNNSYNNFNDNNNNNISSSNSNSNNNINYHTPHHPVSTGGSKTPPSGTPGQGGKENKLLLLLDRLLHQCEAECSAGQNMLPDANCQESCPMEALKTAQACLADTGGRVILLTSSALGCGMGRGSEGVKSGQGQVIT